jgi:hypothetical protein
MRIQLDLSVEHPGNLACELQIPVAGQLRTICIQRQPKALIGRLITVRNCFEDRSALIHLIEHRDFQDLGARDLGVVGLAPEELATQARNLVLFGISFEIVPGEAGENTGM